MFGNTRGYGFGSLYRDLREASDNGVITISPWWDFVVGADDSDGEEVDLE